MHFLNFILVFIILVGLLGFYIGRQIILPLSCKIHWKTGAWFFLFFGLLLTPLQVLLRILKIEGPILDFIAWFGYLDLGFISLIFVLLLARDTGRLLIRLLNKLYQKTGGKCRNHKKLKQLPDIARRRLILNSVNVGLLAGSGLLTGYGCYKARSLPDIKKVEIKLFNLPNALIGLRIVQISDLHVSPTLKRAWVRMIVDQIPPLKPHLIVFTGDLADGSVLHLGNDVLPLAELTAPYGKYFVTGNHEYYSGIYSWLAMIKKLGFTVLLNEHRIICHGKGKITLAGVTDFRAGRFLKEHTSNPEAALSGAPQTDLKILLAHQPKSIFAAAKAGYDLQISGHTHGGQFFPWNLLVGLDQPFTSGLHRLESTQIYVSRGTGYWGPPLRLFAPSEITLLKLGRTENPKGV